MLFRVVTRVTIFMILSSTIATGHGGRTDASGGHNDRKNGGYHYHNSGSSSSSSTTSSSSIVSTSRSSGRESYSAPSSSPSSFSSLSLSSDQTVYKCLSDTGTIIFSSKPCQDSGTVVDERISTSERKSTSGSPSDFTNGSKQQRINEYFRGGNENVGALSCNQVKHDRDVDQSSKNYVKNRDGNKCVICSCTVKLEVDHRRALMNGGDNSVSNLFTLCDDCHKDKTRMDNSLKRKRAKLC